MVLTLGSVGLAIMVLAAVGLAGISSGHSVRLASSAQSTPTATVLELAADSSTLSTGVTTTFASPTVLLFHNGTVTVYADAKGSFSKHVAPEVICCGGGGGGDDVYYTWNEQVCEWQNDIFGITLWKMCLSATWTADQTTGTISQFENPGEDNYEGALGYSMSVDQNTASLVAPGQVNYFAENALLYAGINTGSNPDCWIHGFVYSNPAWGCS